MLQRTKFPRRGPPHSFGWLRVPKHDRDGLAAWEMLDWCRVTGLAELAFLPHGSVRLIQFLPCLPPVLDQTTADDPA